MGLNVLNILLKDAGVAIRHNGEIYYELGNSKGKMPMENVLSALNHPILVAQIYHDLVIKKKSLDKINFVFKRKGVD